MNVDYILHWLEETGSPENRAGMGRFGINVSQAHGVSVSQLREFAKREIGRNDHELAAELWTSGIHEARTLAVLIDDPRQVTEAQMNRWVRDFDSWDVCDGACSVLFDKTPFAYDKTREWSDREEEFVRRAAFALMAALAVHDKRADDEAFLQFLPFIKNASLDERNFVKKAVNWALRQIGKRNSRLNTAAVAAAQEIGGLDSKSARWIASDALRELKGEKVQARLKAHA